MSTVFNMHSENDQIALPAGLIYLIAGYNQYIKDVVKNRAIVGIDGMKPVHRRIFYTMHKQGVYSLEGSADVAGQVMRLHPHGNNGIYDTMTRLVESSDYMGLSFIEGEGFFGKVNMNSTPADMRYTQVNLKSIAKELFEDLDGVQFVPNYNDTKMEPDLIPSPVPLVLCNASSGIAIGVASNIIPGNINEVVDMTVEYIRTGTVSRPLIPDFPSGGEYIYNEKQLGRLMNEGRASIRLRAKVEISGKTITISEIPYYTTVDRILKQINKEAIPGLVEAINTTDFDTGFGMLITCSNRRVVDDVLARCLHLTDLQRSVTANMNIIIDGVPQTLGVLGVLEHWVKHRREVLSTRYNKELETTQAEIMRYTALIRLMTDLTARDIYLKTLLNDGKEAARDYLRTFLPGVKDDVLTFIGGRSLDSLSGIARSEKTLEALKNKEAKCLSVLNNVEDHIVEQLLAFNEKYKFPRRTMVSHQDFVMYEEKEDTRITALPKPVIVVIDGLFIKKIQVTTKTEVEGLNCMSNDILCIVDDRGRFIRVQLEDVDYCKETDRGMYLPVYLGTPEDEFKIMIHERLSDKKVGFVYSDGYASVLDYSEWVGNRKITKVVPKGISEYAGTIVGEMTLDSPYLFVMTKQKRFGFASMDFKHKHRTARTKMINMKRGDEVEWVFEITEEQMRNIVSNADAYIGQTSFLHEGDTFEGVYLENLMSTKG